LKTGEEGGGARDEAMEMALRIKDPKIQATVARALNTTRLGTTGSKDSDSTTDEEEEERVSAKEECARKKAERAKKRSKKSKGIKRADSQMSESSWIRRLNGRREWKKWNKAKQRKRRNPCLIWR
jgi:hypothetical protein